MLTVKEFARIRNAHHRDGMSIRAIARKFHHSRRKVREILSTPEPKPYRRRQEPTAPKLGRFHGLIQQILDDDAHEPPKQRHSMTRVFERLRDEHGYLGGYDAVRRYIGTLGRRPAETFIPLSHEPGQRVEMDFGHIHVDFPDGRRHVPVLLMVWSYSNCPFAMALPNERTEAILEGMVQGFTFFDAVPREVWWDNAKSVAKTILRGRQREAHPRYQALASHYVFEPLFCMPRKGNEKPYVENRVKTLQRRWTTPVPRVEDLMELNRYLRDCCEKDRQRTSGEHSETIGQRFERDRRQAAPLPNMPFDACIYQTAKISKYQTARFDGVRYSVPKRYAFQTATIKAYVDCIEIVVANQVIARHARSYERGSQVLDPLHYLATLQRRPGALDHADVYRQWHLPACFDELRERLEARHGAAAGRRHYVRVLGLLAEHPVERVQQAIKQSRRFDGLDAEVIAARTRQLALQDEVAGPSDPVRDHTQKALRVQAPPTNVNHFDLLLQRRCQP